MASSTRRILLLGYGNPGRQDDGLGPAFADRVAERVARQGLPDVTVDSDYQLQVEDAAAIAEHDVVIFADATAKGPGPFRLRRLEPGGAMSFSTHSVSPSALLALARDHFQSDAEGYALAIHGRAFDGFGEGLSAEALSNLEAALEFLTPLLEEHRIHDVA